MLCMRFVASDAQGHYRIPGIIPGEVDASIRRTAPEMLGFRKLSVKDGESVRWDLECGSASRTSLVIEVVPARAPGIHQQWDVSLSGGGPTGTDNARSNSDESGEVLFERLVPGQYTATVMCSYSDGELVAPEYLTMLQRAIDTSEQRITLRVPEELLRLQPVRGRLVDDLGKGVGGRIVRLQTSVFPGANRLQATTRAKGDFYFPGLAAGLYTLEQLDGENAKTVTDFTVQGDRPEDLGDLVLR